MPVKRFYHTVAGKRKLCRMWLPPDSDAYWHMCGDPEDVAAMTIPTSGGVVVIDVKGHEQAHKINAVMKELKARAQGGLVDRRDFDYYSSPSGDYNQAIDLLLLDLGVEPESKDSDAFIALRDYAQLQVIKAAGPRGGHPRRSRGGPSPELREIEERAGPPRRRPDVHVQPYMRRRYYIEEPRRGGHKVWVGSEKWPSQIGMSRLRRHRKRFHYGAFRESVRKGVATRKRNREN